MQYKTFYTFLFCVSSLFLSQAQKMSIQGHVVDAQSGELLPFAHISLEPGALQSYADQDAYFSFSGLPSGTFELIVHYLGFDTLSFELELNSENPVVYAKLSMKPSSLDLQTITVSDHSARRLSDPNLATYTILPSEIEALPSLGSGDISQYLATLPGVLRTGDLGGQLYIQGGDPSQNLILIDGIPVMNAFHTLNSFSLIPSASIRQASLFGNSYPARYGGRISAVLDIKTKNGNQEKINAMLGMDPFAGELAIHGPLVKSNQLVWKFLVNGRQSWIDRLDDPFYKNVPGGIPFKFTDVLLKSIVEASKGTSLSATYFRSTDEARIQNQESVQWKNEGFGLNMQILPKNTSMLMGGRFAISNYHIVDNTKSDFYNQIQYFQGKIWMQDAGKRYQIRYGFEVNGGRTQIKFNNTRQVLINREDNASELAGFLTYKYISPSLVVETGIRMHYHASLSNLSPEPRLGIKWLLTNIFRVKAGAGRFAQNFVSLLDINDIDNVRLGYVSGPDRLLDNDHNLQKAWHLSGGVEWEMTPTLLFDTEVFWKHYDQLIDINSEKRSLGDSDFSLGSGNSMGAISSLSWRNSDQKIELNYSWGLNKRMDLHQTFSAPFDRRHQANVMGLQKLGKNQSWSLIVRWNYGSGLPFTRTRGFYGKFDFDEGLISDILKKNPDLGIVYEAEKNKGRLPVYHRLDVTVQKTLDFGKNLTGKINASVINIYNRKNLFYFDRVNFVRVDQLPVMPSLGFRLEWK